MKIKILLVALVLVPILLFVQNSVGGIQNPEPDLSASRWASNFESGNLYTSEPEYIEYESLAYTPLYYLLWFSAGKGVLPGQIISILSTLLIVVFIYLISSLYIKGILARVIPGVLFLLSPTTMYWSTITRSDMLALLFVVMGVYLLLRNKLLWASPLFVLAFFTKQWYIVAPIVAVLVFWRKGTLRFSLLYGCLFCLGLLIGQLTTNGEFFRHIFLFPIQSGGSSVIDLGRLGISTLITVGTDPGLLCGLFIVVYRLVKEKSEIFKDYLVMWFLASFLLMLITIGKPGSGTNYGLECLVVGSILTGIVADEILVRGFNATQSS